LQTSTNLGSVTSSSSNKNRRISQLVALCKNGTLRSHFNFQEGRSFQEVNQTTSNFRKYHHFAALAEFIFLKEEIPDLIKQTERNLASDDRWKRKDKYHIQVTLI
jgi:hypothetical protein